MFGEDANWGRVLCAIGYADAEFDINKVDVDLKSDKGEIAVCRNGAGVEFSEERQARFCRRMKFISLSTSMTVTSRQPHGDAI